MSTYKKNVFVHGNDRQKLIKARATDLAERGFQDFLSLLSATNDLLCRPRLPFKVINTIYWATYYKYNSFRNRRKK